METLWDSRIILSRLSKNVKILRSTCCGSKIILLNIQSGLHTLLNIIIHVSRFHAPCVFLRQKRAPHVLIETQKVLVIVNSSSVPFGRLIDTPERLE